MRAPPFRRPRHLGLCALLMTTTAIALSACGRKTRTADTREVTADPLAKSFAGARVPASVAWATSALPSASPSSMPSAVPLQVRSTPCDEPPFDPKPGEEPAVSEDGLLTAFKWIDPNDPDHELLCLQRKGDAPRILLTAHAESLGPDGDPRKNLTAFHALVLTPDKRTLYFSTAAWASEHAIHALDLDPTGAKEIAPKSVRFVHAGAVTAIVDKGPYRGRLVIVYTSGIGNDWAMHRILAMPDGKTIRTLPDDDHEVTRVLGTDVVERKTEP